MADEKAEVTNIGNVDVGHFVVTKGIRRRDSLELIRQPVNKSAVITEEEIKRRYQDTALVIFKEQQQKLKDGGSYLQYGTSRKGAMYSNYGNNAVVVHRKNLIPQSQICAVM